MDDSDVNTPEEDAFFQEWEQKHQQVNELLHKPLPKSLRNCPRCNEYNVTVTDSQLRASDEPGSYVFVCNNELCKHRWVQK